MIKLTNFVSIVTITSIILGCTTDPTYDIQQVETNRQQAIEIQNEHLETHLDTVPGWVLSPPKPNGISFYAIGMGKSADFNIAVKKSKLEAEFELAKTYSQELSGNEKIYARDQFNTTMDSYTIVVEKLIKRVPVVGYSIERQQVVVSNGAYNAYVLLRMPHEQFSALLRQQKEEAASLEIAKAFEDLDRKLNAITKETPDKLHLPSPGSPDLLSHELRE